MVRYIELLTVLKGVTFGIVDEVLRSNSSQPVMICNMELTQQELADELGTIRVVIS